MASGIFPDKAPSRAATATVQPIQVHLENFLQRAISIENSCGGNIHPEKSVMFASELPIGWPDGARNLIYPYGDSRQEIPPANRISHCARRFEENPHGWDGGDGWNDYVWTA